MKLANTIRLLGFFLLSVVSLHAASGQMTTLGIAAGQSQALALRSDGSVWAWGTNLFGEMGISNVTSSSFPLPVPGVSNVVNISAGWQHSVAAETNGTAWAWGTNGSGQLGIGNNNSSPVPVPVSGITNAVMVAGGGLHSLALLANGQIMAWGGNGQGQLGNGTFTSTTLPVLVTGLTNIVKVVAGGYHSVALAANGVVWCWGYGSYGEIGNGHTGNVSTPVAVLSNVVDIAAGGYHTVALMTNGTMWVWGQNTYGQLGFGNTTGTNAPTPVSSLGGVQAIGAGLYVSAATLTNGPSLTWGFHNGTVALPTPLAPAPSFVKFALGMNSLGQNFSLGVTTNGAVWAWGNNQYGQFGNGNLLSPGVANLEFIPTESFAPTPVARWGEFLRGDSFDFGNYTNHDLDFCSIVVPMDLEQGVALNATGSTAYCYSNAAPWFLNVSNQTLYVATTLNSGVIPVNNPVSAFGSQGGGSSLFPNQPYRFGVYAGGFDESTPAATNVIQISVYNATNFSSGATNVAPINVFTIPLPRRTVSADSNLWVTFMTNGAAITVTTNGLTTTVQFLDSGAPTDEAFGISWLNGQVITNFDLTGYELTHVASSTNYFYQVAVLGKVQVGNSSLAPFATNATGVWTPTPLYTLDFATLSPLQSMYVNQLFFQGSPTPPTYAEASVVGPAGLTVLVTNQLVLTNSPVYTNLDSSPELRRHPVLDQFVSDMNNDPLALASYVINQIELADPYGTGKGGTTVMPQVTCGGIDRSALGTFLEGRGSPVEQCALLIYLLRQAGYSAAYVFPTNNNLFLSASHVSQLFEMQVSGVLYPNYIPVITNSLLSLNYPWVVANIGTNTVFIFPWLKDHEIVEGVNLYDYLPANYNTALAWVEQYVRGNTNILSLDQENVVSKLFPEFIEQYLSPLGPSFSTDNLGVRAFNRQHQFPNWSYLPQPDAVTNLNTLQVVDSLGNTTNFPTLANIFNTARVQVYSNSVTGTPLLDSGNFYACDLDDRKFLVFTNNGQLCLWLAPYRPSVTNVQAFAGPSSLNLQSNSVAVGSISYLAIQSIHHRQVATLATPYTWIPLLESSGVTNLAHCNLGDMAAIALDFGQVTPLMLQPHEQTYWGLEQARATNSSFIPKVWDYQGTAAYLLGMGYFQKNDAFDVYDQQWHKLHSLIKFSAGLGIIGATGNATNMQAKVDMFNNIELYLGNASLNLGSGVPDFTSLQNYFTLNITASSAQEHDMIQSMFPDQNAVSTVRLLQMAQARATNGNAPVLEFFQNNYVAYGNQTNAGYGTNLLRNQDTSMWTSVSNIFTQVGANYARVLMTPGKMTNAPKTYIGMGALILGEVEQLAAISGNSAVLNGGWGSEQPAFSMTTPVTQPNLSWNLSTSSDGSSPTFSLNNFSTGSSYLTAWTPEDVAGLLFNPDLGTTPQQFSQATQIAQATGQSGNPSFSLYSAANSGSLGPVNAQAQSLGQWIGEPVNVMSGEFYVDTVDVSLPGPLPLQLRRNYSSLNLQANALGYGWKINFTPYLVVASNLIYAAELNGNTLAYRATNSLWKVLPSDNPTLNNYSTYGVGSTANLFNSVLTTNNSGTNYLISAPDGGVRTYQTMSFPVASGTNVLNRTRPYLTRWQDASGNYALFYYGTNATANDWGQLNRINMANGNTLVFKYDFYGRVIQAITGDGRFIAYQYDSYGDLVTVTLPDASQCQYQYQHYTFTTNGATITDSTHLISQEIKPSGRIVANAYDAMRRVLTQASTVGTNLVLYTNAWFFYTNNFTTNNYLTNQLASGLTVVRDFFLNPTTYYYTNNLITNTVDALGHASLQVWYPDKATNVTGWYPRSLQYTVDKRGLTNQFFYDAFGNVTQTVISGNLTGENLAGQTATNTATYTTNNLPSLVQDPLANGMQITYDSADPFRPLQIVRVSGATPVTTNLYFYTNVTTVSAIGGTNYAYGLGWRQVIAGDTNDSVFNGNGFPIETIQYPATTDDPTNTDPAVIHYLSYNLRGQMYQDQIAGGGTVQYDFDPLGRTISKQIFDQNNNNVSSEFFYYNRNGELEWQDGPRSNPADYVYYIYDGAGRKIQQINFRSQGKSDGSGVEAPAGNGVYATTFQTFDGFGNQTSITDPRGVVTTNLFDALGRVTQQQIWETNGTVLKTEQMAYEPGGQVTLATNALGGVTQTLYTQTGKPWFSANPDGSTNGWTYYLDGRPKGQFLANGSHSLTVYDDVHLLATRTFFSATNTVLATYVTGLDRRGNTILNVDARGNPFTTVYDGLNRVKFTAGPPITNITSSISGMAPPPYSTITYQTNVLAQSHTRFYNPAGLANTNVDSLGQSDISLFDVLGRVTGHQIFNASNNLVRLTTIAYSADHNSATTTEGSGTTAIVSTTYTDNAGQPVLSIQYPSRGVADYVLRQYDADENLIAETRNTAANGMVTAWTTARYVHDGLGRVVSKTDRDGAVTTYAFDAAGNPTNRVMPGGLQWQAAYNSAGQLLRDWNLGAGSSAMTRSNSYLYFNSGSPYAGHLLSKTDGRGVTCTYSYDNWLREVAEVYTGTLPEQNLTTTFQYEPRGYVTNYSEQFATNTTGPATIVARTYDVYGQLATESVNGGPVAYSDTQTWDVAGRRTQFNVGNTANYGFAWRSDFTMAAFLAPNGTGLYGFDTAGLLTNRTATIRSATITARDGEGRPLNLTTTVNGSTVLTESLSWLGDGLLATHTLADANFNDYRSYAYAPLSRRLTQEILNLNSATIWTNNFAYDGGSPQGPGVLTSVGQTNAQWSGGADAFSRLAQATNTTVTYSAQGHVAGWGNVNLWLDNRPVAVAVVGTNNTQWSATMELSPGPHQLVGSAVQQPTSQFTSWATNSFTNSIPYQTTSDTLDLAGNTTQRVWLNSNGTTNRVETLSWDARGRLHAITERDATSTGYNWTAVYDPLNRRLSTTSILVTNGVAFTTFPNTINQYYDPQADCLELGVSYGTKNIWKLYGPDLNGVYGGLNGRGGFDGYTTALGLFFPTICDFRGNVLGYVTNGSVMWNPSRPTAYGAVPGYRPVALGNGANVPQSSAWGSLWPDITGYYNFHQRVYDPITGHWLSGDPSWNEWDPNWYTFCGGDPVNHTDPDGMLATTAGNYTVGLGQGFLQASTGISTGNPTDTANYNGQATGRDLSFLVSTWLTAQGLTTTGGGATVMAGSLAVEVGSGGTASVVAGPAFVGGAITTAVGATETGVGAYGIYTFMSLPPLQSPSNDSGSGGSQDSSGQTPASGQGSTPIDSGYVDLTDSQGSQHILDSDAYGGGHAPGTGISGKSEFPATWSNDQILDTISDIATGPDQVWSKPDSRGYITTTATVNGVDIKVVVDTNKGRIVTGYPTNLPRNP